MKKRILSLFLVMIMIVGLAPVIPASATTPVLSTITFENNNVNNFAGRGGVEKLTVSTAQARNGTRSLLVANRSQSWHGAALRVEKYIEANTTYQVSAWVRLRTPASAEIKLSTQTGTGNNAQYHTINSKTVKDNGWTQLSGTFIYNSSHDLKHITIYFESQNATAEFFIDDVSFIKDPASAKRLENINNSARLPALKDIYKDHFMIGGLASDWDLEGGIALPIAYRHFNIFTLPNELKPSSVTSARNVYNFSAADKWITPLRAEGMNIVGHTLLWHEQHADWLTNNVTTGRPLTRTQARTNMQNHINKVAGQYKGQIYSWDVLNEAMNDFWGRDYNGNWRDNIRKDTGTQHLHGYGYSSPWYMAYANGATARQCGSDYIYDAFVFARLADPNAILYYNDYGIDTCPKKAAAVADMIKDLNNQWRNDSRNTRKSRLLIEGIGLQGHFNINDDIKIIENNVKLFADTGLKISITELDVNIFGWGKNADGKLKPTVAQFRKQAELLANLFVMFKKYSNNIERVTFWGLTDKNNEFWLPYQYPHLFNVDFTPKLAYFAVADPEGYLKGNYNTAAKRNTWVRNNSPILKRNVDARVATDKGVAHRAFIQETVPANNQRVFTVGAQHAGKAVRLYRYDINSLKFVSISNATVGADGRVTFTNIRRTGDYLYVVR